MHDTKVASTNLFSIITTGDNGRRAICSISDPDGQTVYFNNAIGVTEVFFKRFSKTGSYTMIISDYNHPYDNYWISTFDVESDDVVDYLDTTYGDFYAEFYNTGETCYYEVGMSPFIVYKVNDTYINAEYFLPPILPFYTLEIVKSDNVVVYTTQIRSNESTQFLFPEYAFGSPVSYYIRVWNMSYGELMGYAYYDKKDIVWQSYPITVCPEGTSKTQDNDNDGIPNEIDNAPDDYNPDQADTDKDGIPDVIDPDPDTPNIPDEEFGHGLFPKIDGTLGAIMGLCITISCIIIPLVIGGQTGVEVPIFAYALSGAMGLAVSTILGLFPPWIIFFIVAIGLIVVFLMYFTGVTHTGD